MRRQQASSARTGDHFLSQRLVRAVRGLTRVVLKRHHLLGDEAASGGLQFTHLRWDVEVHVVFCFSCCSLIPIPCHDITGTEGSIAQRREHKERMAPGICVKAFQASQQASTICS